MNTISSAISETDHYSTRRQLLSIVAGDFSVSTLRARLPGVSEYLIKEARKLVYHEGKQFEVHMGGYDSIEDAQSNTKHISLVCIRQTLRSFALIFLSIVRSEYPSA